MSKTFESFMLAKGYARSAGFKLWQKDGITITSDEVQALFDEYVANTK